MKKKSCSIEVIHMIDGLTPGGTERILVELVNALSRQGVSVGVCVTRSSVTLAAELDPEIELLVLNRKSTWNLKAIAQFTCYCKKRNVQILHAHSRSTVKFAALIKFLRAAKLTLIFHDHFGEIRVDRVAPPSLKFVSRKFVDWYIAVSSELQEWAVKELEFDSSRTAVLGNAVDLARFQTIKQPADLNKVSQPFKAAMIANLRPQKDHKLLFDVLASSSLNQRLHVYLIGLDAGDAYSQEVRQWVAELKLESAVSFLGLRTDVPEILKAVDFGLLCSRSESGPVVLLEYMASRLPFLATNTGQIACQLNENSLQYFVEPGDTEAFTLALHNLLSLTAEDKEIMLEKNDQFLRDHFNIQQRVSQLILIYQTLGLFSFKRELSTYL